MRLKLLFLASIASLAYPAMAGDFPNSVPKSAEVSAEASPVVDENCQTMVAGRIGPSLLVGESAALAPIRAMIAKLANSNIPVLITGETGTGKEVVANSLYTQRGAKGPFVVVNMAVIPESLADSLFFGAERGAFTGAVKTQTGFFEAADGGTIFLDEIGEMPLGLQAKLLRVLDNYGFSRVGSNKVLKPKFRLICATNRDLRLMVQKKLFREDLFYRLQTITLQLPPLRERLEDIPALAQHLLDQVRVNEPGAGVGEHFSVDAIKKLQGLSWPGNIRELRTVVTRAYLVAEQKEIGADDIVLLEALRTGHEHSHVVRQIDDALASGDVHALQSGIKELDRIRILSVVRTHRSPADAAAFLGIPVKTLAKICREYEINL